MGYQRLLRRGVMHTALHYRNEYFRLQVVGIPVRLLIRQQPCLVHTRLMYSVKNNLPPFLLSRRAPLRLFGYVPDQAAESLLLSKKSAMLKMPPHRPLNLAGYVVELRL